MNERETHHMMETFRDTQMQEDACEKDGVRVMRGMSLEQAMNSPFAAGRATAFHFAGSGGNRTWVGKVEVDPGDRTNVHHHGRHEVVSYVMRGRCQILWGSNLQFKTEVGEGDFIYFAPYAPHQTINLDPHTKVELLVVRSDDERISIEVAPSIRCS